MKLWIFFGQSGAGKSFVGRICAEEFGFEQYDGDRDLTPEMRDALREQRLFTPEMRAEFTTVLSRSIGQRWSEYARSQAPVPGLAVCQGLFKIRDRAQLRRAHPDARMIWVRASEALIATRLQKRTGHVASSAYARMINSGFEPPAVDSDILDNDGDRARIIEQLRAYLR